MRIFTVIIIFNLFIFGTALAQPEHFPAELMWDVEIENPTCLGTIWLENGVINAIVGTGNGLILISDGNIIWSNNEIGSVLVTARFEFDDGPSLIACTLGDNHGIVNCFNGEGFNEIRTGEYGIIIDTDWEDAQDCDAKCIIKCPTNGENGSCEILIWCSYTYYSRSAGGWLDGSTGAIHRFSLSEMQAQNRITIWSPGNYLNLDINGDNRKEALFAGNRCSSDHGQWWDTRSYSCGLSIFDDENQLIEEYRFASSSGEAGGPPGVTAVGVGYSTAYILNDQPYFVAAMMDTSGRELRVYDASDFQIITRRSIRYNNYCMGVLSGDHGEPFLMCLKTNSEVYIYHLPELQPILHDTLNVGTILAAYLDDVNEDDFDELVVLTSNSLKLYTIGTLDVEDFDSPTIIPDFNLISAYPNPFNSTTTIEYALPFASDVTLSLYNLSGQRVETLVSGRMQAGVHSTMLDAGNLATGLYFIKLDNGLIVDSQKIILVR